MSRWDHDDPRDEHDINELRKAIRGGGTPQFAGKKSAGFCGLITLALVAFPVVGAVATSKGWV
jgi:hypothetical protein